MPDLKLEYGKAYRTAGGHRVTLVDSDNPSWPFRADAPGTPFGAVWYRSKELGYEECDGASGQRLPEYVIVSEWADKPDDTLNLRLNSSPEMRQAVALENIADALNDIAALLAARPIAAGAAVAPRADQPDADGWIAWNGGEPPITLGTLVTCRDADGHIWPRQAYQPGGMTIGDIFWRWDEDVEPHNRIVAYKL